MRLKPLATIDAEAQRKNMSNKEYTTKEIKDIVDEILQENYEGIKGQVKPVNIRKIVTNYGVTIEEREFPVEKNDISAFMVFPNPKDATESPIVVLNKKDPEKRKRFAIAHSFGHLVLHPHLLEEKPFLSILYKVPEGRRQNSTVEGEANCFALFILLPYEDLFSDHQEHANTSDHREEWAEALDVSEELVGLRLDLNIANTQSDTNEKRSASAT